MKFIYLTSLFFSVIAQAQTTSGTPAGTGAGSGAGTTFNSSTFTGSQGLGATPGAPVTPGAPGTTSNSNTGINTTGNTAATLGAGTNNTSPDMAAENTNPATGVLSTNGSGLDTAAAAGSSTDVGAGTGTATTPESMNTSPNPTPNMDDSGTFDQSTIATPGQTGTGAGAGEIEAEESQESLDFRTSPDRNTVPQSNSGDIAQ